MQHKPVTSRLESLLSAQRDYKEALMEADNTTDHYGKVADDAWERLLLAEAKVVSILNAGR